MFSVKIAEISNLFYSTLSVNSRRTLVTSGFRRVADMREDMHFRWVRK